MFHMGHNLIFTFWKIYVITIIVFVIFLICFSFYVLIFDVLSFLL